jgi:hypothetical protein
MWIQKKKKKKKKKSCILACKFKVDIRIIESGTDLILLAIDFAGCGGLACLKMIIDSAQVSFKTGRVISHFEVIFILAQWIQYDGFSLVISY